MFNEWEEKILDQLKNNHQQCQNLVLARGRDLRQRSGEIELSPLKLVPWDGQQLVNVSGSRYMYLVSVPRGLFMTALQ